MARRLAAALAVAGLASIAAAPAGTAPGGVTIAVPKPYALVDWDPNTDNVAVVPGRVTLGGQPVAGLRLRVDGWRLPQPTGADGAFAYPLDVTRLARHVVVIVDASAATIAGAKPTEAQRAALERATAAISAAYAVRDLRAGRDRRGNPTLSGRVVDAGGKPPPPVALYTYELRGTVTDADGRPVAGARVSARTTDRDFWSLSRPTDERGRYSSFFTASSERGGNPVPFVVRVSKGDLVWEFLPDENVLFQRLESARMDIRLPPRDFPLPLPSPTSYPGAIYEGVLVGVAVGGEPVRPLAATWPDGRGRFTLTLPRSLAGRTVTVWQGRLDLFSKLAAQPGGSVDLRDWPAELPPSIPQELAAVRLR